MDANSTACVLSGNSFVWSKSTVSLRDAWMIFAKQATGSRLLTIQHVAAHDHMIPWVLPTIPLTSILNISTWQSGMHGTNEGHTYVSLKTTAELICLRCLLLTSAVRLEARIKNLSLRKAVSRRTSILRPILITLDGRTLWTFTFDNHQQGLYVRVWSHADLRALPEPEIWPFLVTGRGLHRKELV